MSGVQRRAIAASIGCVGWSIGKGVIARRALRRVLCVAVALALSAPAALEAAPRAYTIAGASSEVAIIVGKSGLFSGFGHVHHVLARRMSGEVVADPDNIPGSTLTIRFASAGLEVVDADESRKDRDAVQQHMQSDEVLGIAAFPAIVFESFAVEGRKSGKDAYDVVIKGNLRLRGVKKEVDVPAQVRIDANGLNATGSVSILQTSFGITPNRVALGAVKVKDELKINFRIQARPRESAPRAAPSFQRSPVREAPVREAPVREAPGQEAPGLEAPGQGEAPAPKASAQGGKAQEDR